MKSGSVCSIQTFRAVFIVSLITSDCSFCRSTIYQKIVELSNRSEDFNKAFYLHDNNMVVKWYRRFRGRIHIIFTPFVPD